VRLARIEEREALAEFTADYERYMREVSLIFSAAA
jgi:protein-S-isoprenylcysteine O-methyltransferase Ste14